MSGDGQTDTGARRDAISTLAVATADELVTALALFDVGAVQDLKPPQVGLVMLRGRTGGDGAAFNLGEATVTRAIVRLATGEIGFGARLGRDKAAARSAAILDALWQTNARREIIEAEVLGPVRARLAAERERASAETAATKVEFFTLARESA